MRILRTLVDYVNWLIIFHAVIVVALDQKYAYKSIRFQYVYENQPERFKNDVDFLVDLLKDVTKKGISSH